MSRLVVRAAVMVMPSSTAIWYPTFITIMNLAVYEALACGFCCCGALKLRTSHGLHRP